MRQHRHTQSTHRCAKRKGLGIFDPRVRGRGDGGLVHTPALVRSAQTRKPCNALSGGKGWWCITQQRAAFTANATRTNCLVAESCVSNTNLSGNFFGQTGGGIAGVGTVHETANPTTGTVETKGSFTFIGTR